MHKIIPLLLAYALWCLSFAGALADPPTQKSTGACCFDDGMTCYNEIEENECVREMQGTWMGADSECGIQMPGQPYPGCNSTAPTGACCLDDGMICYDNVEEINCIDTLQGTWMGVVSECGIQMPGQPYSGCNPNPLTGACCFDNGMTCYEGMTDAECNRELGTWRGAGSECGEYDDETGYSGCDVSVPTGACCFVHGMICYENMPESECVDEEGTWMGVDSECSTYDPDNGYEGCNIPDTYDYLPGDANMSTGNWPPSTIGGDVTYLVNYFRGITAPCMLDGFYAAADANGSCSVTGADVTKLVSYFRGMDDLSYCPDYPTTWPPIPDTAPVGWPNCASPVLSK